jgi:hypothetical protein
MFKYDNSFGKHQIDTKMNIRMILCLKSINWKKPEECKYFIWIAGMKQWKNKIRISFRYHKIIDDTKNILEIC